MHEYKYLFVKASLKPQKTGDDLTDFLLDRITNAIDLISDEEVRTEIQDRLTQYEGKYHAKDSLLHDALETIKAHDYSMILIMDEFHNMGRNSSVGSEQYDFLRSLNEGNLLYYWIISDSDFSDVYATEQFTTSFFAQKFIPETIPQMRHEDMIQLLKEKAAQDEVSLSDTMIETIYGLIGGIPGFVIPAIKIIGELELEDDSAFDSAVFVEYMLAHPRCASLLNSWSRSLKEDQKYILLDIAEQDKVYQSDVMTKIGKINQLGDHSGLGLLIHGSDSNGKYWKINAELFRRFIIDKGDDFFSAALSVPEKKTEASASPAPTTVQNYYFTANNYFFNPNDAVKSLVALKEIVERRNLPSQNNSYLTEAVQSLPYQQSGWDSLDDQQKDEQMDDYADKIFASGEFRADSLSETQMARFFLTQPLLDRLSTSSRDNLISAIQVYDLLQFCIDRFGLNLNNSESARGILFARLYESMLKENLNPAFCSVKEIASKSIDFVGKRLFIVSNVPYKKLTIGYYARVLEDPNVQKSLSTICTSEINRSSNDSSWWFTHQQDMLKIADLRNECCHSGNSFTHARLESLIRFLFELHAIANIEVYNDITNRPRLP